MESHRINYYGLELEVYGNYDEPEEETGYKGGWSSEQILNDNDIDIVWMLRDSVIDEINRIVLEENY